MTQHFKLLFQQIQPLLYNTPFSQVKKQDEKSEANNCRRELAFANKDSGLDTSSCSSPKKNQLCRSSTRNELVTRTCKSCASKLEQKVQMRKKLKKSYLNYVNSNLNEQQFAHIPLVISKSFRPKSDSLNKLQVRKGTAVNALYMIDNKWIYVKTASEKCGFIPAKCCHPFDMASKCRHVKNIPKIKLPDLPVEKMSEEDHTYVSVDQNMYEKLGNFKSDDVESDYGLLAEAESVKVHQYDCLMTYTPKAVKQNNEQNYYNCVMSSAEKKTPNLFKVRKEFKSTFFGGITLSKGDLVYMINTNLSNELKILNKQNLAFVRVYKRFTSQKYENISEPSMLQGFVPKANLIKLNNYNQNSPIYC